MDYNKILNKNILNIINILHGKRLYFSQILELTKIKSKNNLLKNLNILVDFKILQREKNKSNTFYKINYQNNFSQSFLQLINAGKLQSLPFERRSAIKDTIIETSPALAILFGSSAKSNFKKESDIDILLIYNEKNINIKDKIKEISSRYGVRINPIIMNFSELDTRIDATKHILKTGYPLTGQPYFYEVLKNV